MLQILFICSLDEPLPRILKSACHLNFKLNNWS